MATFLIADDSDGKRMFLKSVLKHAKWDGEILEAATTEDASVMIQNEKNIDAAFIDYEIPSQNGPAVIHELHAKFPAAHIALVTSADSRRYEDDAREAGAEAFVCTSWTEDRVVKALMDLLDQWRQL